MKDLSNTTLWEFLESIRERTRQNIIQIKENKKAMSNIEKELLSPDVKNLDSISELKDMNQQLTEENFQLLDLHKNIIAVGDLYHLYSVNKTEESKTPDFDENDKVESDYLKLIREGKFNIDRHFYFLENEDVAEDIYESLLAFERYEECARVLRFVRENKESLRPWFPRVINGLMFWKKH